MDTLTILLLIGGTIILAATMRRSLRILRQLPSGRLRRLWLVQTALMSLFILGYSAYLVRCISEPTGSCGVVGMVFLLGACFVYHTACLSAHTLRLLKRSSRLRTESITDPLTGLFNRRHLDAILEQEVERCRVRGMPLSALMIDLDHFKAVNDTRGHQTGDAVLADLGALLLAQVRAGDVATRYGGEEVLVLAPDASAASARLLAERLRCAVASRAFACAGTSGSIGCTVSIGVATLGPNARHLDGLGLIRQADAALYQAKRNGRDRVVQAASHGIEDPPPINEPDRELRQRVVDLVTEA